MNTESDTAFIDCPPEGFAIWSTKTKHLVRHAVVEAGVSMSDVHLYGSYACISQGNREPNKENMMDAFCAMDDATVEALESYINRVTEREAQSEVETEGAGKP